MVLFQNDWEQYPDAIADTSTKNSSFMHYAGLLKTMGVENHLWPLQLLNPKLKGVNPRANDLSLVEMGLIAQECKSNYFYFIREVMIIPGSDERETVMFESNRGNMSMYWLYFNHVIPYVVMIRQSGKSFGMDTLDVWQLNIRLYFSNISLVTKDETLRSANMKRIKDIEETLPWYLKMRSPKDPANSEEYKVSRLKNVLRAHLANKSEKIARNLGRGLTDQITRFDELAYLFNIEISLPAALAAGVAARDRARRRGDPYGTILATTAGKKDDRDGSYAFKLLMDSAPWSESMMDCVDEEDLHKTVKSQSRTKDLMVIASFIHSQLGKSDEWLDRAVRESKATGEDAERDFGNRWTSGSLTSPLGPELSAVVRGSEMLDPYVDINHNFGYAVRWYVPEHQMNYIKDRHTVLSLDTSDAIGRDDIGFILEDSQTGGIIAAADFNEINLFEFSKWIAEFLVKFPKCTLIPEARSSGRAMIDYIVIRLCELGIDPFTRIYNTVVQYKDERPQDYEQIRNGRGLNPDICLKFKKTFGFATAGTGDASRNILYGRVLKSWATYCGRMAHDSRLINQVLSLVVRNGRIDHQMGGHDDLCVAALLGHWFLSSAKNINHYGIPSGTVLTVIDSPVKHETQEQKYKHFVNIRIRNEIKELGEKMQKEPDEFLYARMLTRVKALHGALSSDEAKAFSVSEFLEQVEDLRNKYKASR